ncbi:MBL fold metallo-hydrolase [Pontibacter sp. MBLB2868]|uniref:MBL fold metallo-hydrolase n=1 Tax=Pontibacter sp. MBLB2868 TaxID=3451555 RepID=UPI003F752277
MKITRLSWAGIIIQQDSTMLMIDPVEDFTSMEPYMGRPLAPVIPFAGCIQADAILLTHVHPDHLDEDAIRNTLRPGGKVICHKAAADKLRELGFPVHALELNQPHTCGVFTVTPVFALDGIGHEQVSWLVRNELGQQLFHGGDTIWHSRFWEINNSYGKIDVAFLPINGVVVNYPFVGFAPLPASLTPEQAVVAAKIMHTDLLVPMHYGTFHCPPIYTEFEAVEEVFVSAALKYDMKYKLIPEGGMLRLAEI